MSGSGVYTFSTGIKAWVAISESGMVFENRLFFPDNDFRKEYNGECANGQVMHGEGHLTLKNGKVYKGIWINGQSDGYIEDLQIQEIEWNARKA